MYIKQDQVKKAVENADKNCKLMNVKWNSVFLESYEKMLKSMAETHKYQEGEAISPEDVERISQEAKTVLIQLEMATRTLYKDDPESMHIANPVDYMMVAADYLQALAMQHLGSPDMKPHFGTSIESVIGTSATRIYRDVVKFAVSTDKTYEAQRGKNANELKASGIEERIQAVKNSEAKTKDVAQLIADYQALQRRQENHGSVWRFFHRSENKARNALLAEMATVLKTKLGKTYDPETVDPSYYAKKISDEKFLATLERAEKARNHPEKIYGLNAPEKNAANTALAAFRSKLNDKEKENLIADTNEKTNNAMKAPVHESTEKVLTGEVKI